MAGLKHVALIELYPDTRLDVSVQGGTCLLRVFDRAVRMLPGDDWVQDCGSGLSVDASKLSKVIDALVAAREKMRERGLDV